MAGAGKTIENPFSGERIHFAVTGRESGGRYLSGWIHLAPFGAGPPGHVHPTMEERFRVTSGTLSGRVGGAERTYGPGEELVVPAGVPHRWWNEFELPPSDAEARVARERGTVAPGDQGSGAAS